MGPDRFSDGRAAGDLPGLLKRYVRQETVEPLRSAGRFLLFGLVGASLLGLGTVLLAVGGLRGLQASGLLDGSWSWVPYLAAAGVLSAVAAVTVTRIGGPRNLDG
jgi:hypothetical protein|tara:strand:- start:3330 stop:3644 length:315 start_codon:yes stop_codon:yes gene_type:complete